MTAEIQTVPEVESTVSNATSTGVVGYYAAILSITEVGLGSLLYLFQMPFFVGFVLSLNQIFLLNRASYEGGKTASRLMPASISFIGAILKSLAPFGKKLMPMIGISMQGLLYNIPVILFGHCHISRLIGSAISSVWSIVHVFLIYYVIFGYTFFIAISKLYERATGWLPFAVPSIQGVIVGIVILKVILAIASVYLAESLSSTTMNKYFGRLKQFTRRARPVAPTQGKKKTVLENALLALKDICMLPFLFCALLSSMSFYLVPGVEDSWFLLIVRPMAFGFLCFFLIRITPVDKLMGWLERKNFHSISKPLKAALEKMQEF